MGAGQREPAAEQAADGGNTEMGLTLCSPELRHRTPRISFLIDERPHRECHSPKCFFPSIATASYGWCISGSLSPHRESSRGRPCGVLQNAIVGPRVIRGTRRILTASLRIGHDRTSRGRLGGTGRGPMSNGCGVSGYAVGKVSVSLAHMGYTPPETPSRGLRRLSFRRLCVAERGIVALNSAGS